MKAMVLAGGAGTRLGEISENNPKVLTTLAGETVLEHDLRWLAAAGVREVVIGVSHLARHVRTSIGEASDYGLERLSWSEEDEPLGTAGALRPVADEFRDAPFLLLNGDNWFDFDLEALLADHRTNPAIATLSLFSTDAHWHTGGAGQRVDRDRSGRILRLVQAEVDPSLELVNATCYVLDPVLLDHVPPGPSDIGRDLLPRVLQAGAILWGHVIRGFCLGIDTPEALTRAREILDRMRNGSGV